jgi:hypothetical protein
MKSNMIPLFLYRFPIFLATETLGKRYETQDKPCVKRKNEATDGTEPDGGVLQVVAARGAGPHRQFGAPDLREIELVRRTTKR